MILRELRGRFPPAKDTSCEGRPHADAGHGDAGCFSRRFGALAAHVGPRLLIGFGPLVAAGGAALFTRLGEHVSFVSQLLPAAVIFGPGMSMTVSPLTATVLGSVPAGRAGVASGVNNALARIASLVAIAIVGVLVSLRFDRALEHQVGPGRVASPERAQILRLEARPLSAPPVDPRRSTGPPRPRRSARFAMGSARPPC